MKRIRKLLLVLLTTMLVLPSFPVSAAPNDNVLVEGTPQGKGEISSKDEVVYAKLTASGERQEIYVVNILDIAKSGKVVDYGQYSSLKNITDLSQLKQNDNTVEFTAPKGKFYYQGNMNDAQLPWDLSVSYFLDGKEIAPNQLPGKDGHVQIQITTSANEHVDEVFFQNYLLQISLSLNLELYSNIQAPKGMLANAGKNKQVTFTVMPEKEETVILEADVVDFELDGIDITAVPSSMSIDAPDLDSMTGNMQTLTNAIKEVHKGIASLKNGVSELNDGAVNFRSGSMEYKDGILTINDSSSEIITASKSMEGALGALTQSLANNTEGMNIDDLKKLEEGLVQAASGLSSMTADLTTLKANFASAYSALNKAMAAIPKYEISEEELQKLYDSIEDHIVLNRLVETHKAALTAKATFSNVKADFNAVDVTLSRVTKSMNAMARNLNGLANELSAAQAIMTSTKASLSQMQQGLSDLTSNYKGFHSGLVDYTAGVGQLANSYDAMHNGTVDMSNGTGALENGVSKLHNGTAELYESTSDLPHQMKQEVDQLIADFDKSDFDPVSFVSPKNEKINSVQFIFKTESIKQEEPVETEKTVTEKISFWARLKSLFQ